MKKFLIALISIASVALLLFEPSSASAERVYGHGAAEPLATQAGTNSFLDETVIPPLSESWSLGSRAPFMGDAPLDKGMVITSYRVLFGSRNTIYGISNQTGSTDTSEKYDVGIPFAQEFPSQYGRVSSNMRITTIPGLGQGIYFGTSSGFMGNMSSIANQSDSERKFNFSGQNPNGTSRYYGGAIKYMTAGGHYSSGLGRQGDVFASNTKLHYMNGNTMVRDWYFDLDQLPNTDYQSGDKYTGLISLPKRNEGFMAFSESQDGSISYGLVWDDAKTYDKSYGEFYSNAPDTVITYRSGIPKAGAFDEETGTIVAVDKKGRVYFHRKNGSSRVSPSHGDWLYAGDSLSRGYDSAGGVLIQDGAAYMSTFDSSKGTGKGTITKFNLANPTLNGKLSYIHDAKITTQPIYLSGLIYFGDERGRVYALHPTTLEKVDWFRPNNSETNTDFANISTNEEIVSLVGADNHLIAATDNAMSGWKGRPDYIVSDIKEVAYGNGTSDLDNKRFDFNTASIPPIDIRGRFENIGSFDYSIYTDFNGQNDQRASLNLRNLDSGEDISIASNLINSPFSVSGHKFSTDRGTVTAALRPYLFQLPASGEKAQMSFPFSPKEEGKYEVTFGTNSDRLQTEFLYTNNDKSAVFDVVDMRTPSMESEKAEYTPGETIKFTNSKYQTASYVSYRAEIIDSKGKTVYESANKMFAPTLTTELNSSGEYRYRISILNRYGDTISSSFKPLSILNAPPAAKITYDPATIYNDTTVELFSNASDADGDELTYQWSYQEPRTRTWIDFSTDENPVQDFPIKGKWHLRLIVSDPYTSTTVTNDFWVVNRAPIPEFDWNPSTIFKGTTVSFENESSDPDKDPLTYQWAYQEPGTSTWVDFSTTENPSLVLDKKGSWNVRLTANDGEDTKSVTKILSVDNRPPVADFNWNPSTIYNDTSVTFSDASTDVDGDTLTYQWAYQEPGTSGWIEFSTDESPSQVFNKKGKWNIRLTVSDGALNHSVTKSMTVQNRPPVADFNWNPTTIFNDTKVDFVNSSSDVDKDSLTYQWAYQEPESSSWKNFSTDEQPSRTFDKKGSWSIRLTVSDGAATHSKTKVLNVGNRGPKANFGWNPATIYNDTNVIFEDASSDLDNDSLSYAWAYQEPGTSKWIDFSTTENPERLFEKKGTWKIRLTVSDGAGTDSIIKSLTVQNRPPEAKFSWNPETIHIDTSVTFKNSSSDVDGDKLTYEWSYQEPGTTKWVEFSKESEPTQVFNKKGQWKIRLTANDGADSHSAEKEITVENRPPVTAFTWNPTTVYTNTEVTFANTSTDPDDDELTYQWAYQAPGTSTWTDFSKEKTPSYEFDQIGKWNIRLTTSDGSASTPLTKALTVLNTPPEVSLTYAPQTVYEGDTVTLTAKPTDLDDDTMTVVFEENRSGVWQEIHKVEDVESGDTLTHSFVAAPQTYDLRVRAVDSNDGEGMASVTFEAIPLEIEGFVNHTAEWQAIHDEAGHTPEQFYAGERFLTEAVVTDHPIEKVTVSFAGEQITGNLLTLSSVMDERTHPVYEKEVYEKMTGDPDEHLAPGMAYFVFEAEWKNGVVKQNQVSINIVNDVYGAFDFYRTN
ncbi:PKD domain-containing protein [Planococcus alpniumensis]|uniref:PKD domain-containing protein n=1 Tax=Planococcus alpniumensis TaxID=2708345 RepID=UPI001B8C6924|nr:PKD domain-containing protein [Planococcus sp. MSAK28401]